MEDHLLSIFQAELGTQCKFVIMGAQQVNAALKQQSPGTDGVWFGLQSILISASNASKLLWGAGRTDKEAQALHEARRPLRESVGVDDSSPLNSRRVRNSFEHFDERIDDWFKASENHNYVGRNIGPPNMIVIDGAPPDDHFGHFDPSTSVVTFWDRSAELNPIVGEAEKILGVLQNLRGRPMAQGA